MDLSINQKTKNFLNGINDKRPKTWKKLFLDYHTPLCNFAFSILKDRDISKDIVQDVFISIWERPLKFEVISQLNKYLYKSVYNNCLKYIRDAKREQDKIEEISILEFDNPEILNQIMLEEVVRKLESLISTLPSRQKMVILMSLKKMKNSDIAKELSISINTVKKHKKKAYVFIRNKILADLFLISYFITQL